MTKGRLSIGDEGSAVLEYTESQEDEDTGEITSSLITLSMQKDRVTMTREGDYSNTMGVPITFLTKYNPEQFEIVGMPTASSNEGSLNLGIDYSKHIGYKQNGENSYHYIH